jgi:CTP:molybdopterin cytidylyltransferase MocA/broad specificity phosphatase PhoE
MDILEFAGFEQDADSLFATDAETYAIVLAGGMSTRMGEFKPLLDVSGQAAILELLDTLVDGGVDNVVIVTGHNHEAIEQIINEDFLAHPVDRLRTAFHIVYNPDYEDGMMTSVQTGVRYIQDFVAAPIADEVTDLEISSTIASVMIIPVDMPAVDDATIRTVWNNDFDVHGIAIPTYMHKNGHPIGLSAKYLDEIVNADIYTGTGTNLKAILNAHETDTIHIETDDQGCVLDMDDLKSYEELTDYMMKGDLKDRLRKALKKRKATTLIMRHGEIEQHEDKIFLGQYDAALSDIGAETVRDAIKPFLYEKNLAKEIQKQGLAIFTSPLLRASASADIVSETFVQMSQNTSIQIMQDLSEIALGRWDGRLISDVKAEEPDLYEARGKDLLGFKKHGGESFYDLRYRALMELLHIIEDTDKKKPVIIVTHRMVIQAILGFTQSLSDEDAAALEVGYGEVTKL